jgi:hypothetical protein
MNKTTSKNLNPNQETGLTVPDPLDPKYVRTYSPQAPYQTPSPQQDTALNISHKQSSDTWQSMTTASHYGWREAPIIDLADEDRADG